MSPAFAWETLGFLIVAGPHELFSSSAGDGLVGKTTKVDGEDAEILSAVVADDGHSMEVTVRRLDT